MAKTPSTPDAADGSDQDPLVEMLCFNLYAAARATNRLYLSLLSPWDLTYPQYLVLRLLWSRESVTVGQIAESLVLDSGTTSPLVRRLETRGLVKRSRSTADERIVRVTLTAQGRALESDLVHLPSQVGTGSGLGLEEAQATIAALRSMTGSLAEVTAQFPAVSATRRS